MFFWIFSSSSLALLLLTTPVVCGNSSDRWTSSSSKVHYHRGAGRRLSLAEIAGYEPGTVVTDANAIDLDVQAMEMEMDKNSEDGFANALKIYALGGNSGPFANLTLNQQLSVSIPDGTQVTGVNTFNTQVLGSTLGNQLAGSRFLTIHYFINEQQDNYVHCRVGGLASINAQDTTGCFAATGQLSVTNAGTFPYTYNANDSTFNSITLSGMSRDIAQRDSNMYPVVRRYHTYYDLFDYADEFVRAALQAAPTTELQRGRSSFAQAGYNGRNTAAATGVVVLNLWMKVLLELNRAVAVCDGTLQDGVTAQRHFDWGVAYYTGSLEGVNGNGDGRLLHQLADDFCVEFGTCGSDSDANSGRAFANVKVLTNFRRAKSFLFNSDSCGSLKTLVQGIEVHMLIPLIQGTLKFAYERSVSPNDMNQGGASAFMTAILPNVHACNPQDASTIYRNMNEGSSSVAFHEVKQALQDNYACKGVTCRSIGGYFNSDLNTYNIGAEPCSDNRPLDSIGSSAVGETTPTTPPPVPVTAFTPVPTPGATYASVPVSRNSSGSSGSNNETAVIAGSVSAAVVVAIAILIVLFVMVRRNKESDPERQGNAPEFTPAEEKKESAEMT